MVKLLFFVAAISGVMAGNSIEFFTDINASGKRIACTYHWDKCYKFPENFGLSSWAHHDLTVSGSGGISVTLYDDPNCGNKFTRWAIKQKFANTEIANYFPNELNDNHQKGEFNILPIDEDKKNAPPPGGKHGTGTGQGHDLRSEFHVGPALMPGAFMSSMGTNATAFEREQKAKKS
ncbi:hypothetical protein BG004_003202 [Podila humilis]|nr:hypothetical protein BG004_003202 [Podila humilis]